ncbi:hypothetical protein KM043_009602 [Ampulex compressa]|nr:hypothetical protein KM043_009602 [Ampulex compressa]
MESERRKRAGEVCSSKEQPYITACEKRPSTGRLISEALPPAPFTASLNPRAGHESRHSVAPPPLPLLPSVHPSATSVYPDLRPRGAAGEKRHREQSSL